jgi:hypothetical protein
VHTVNKLANRHYANCTVNSGRIKPAVNFVIISDLEMDGVKSEPDSEGDRELAAAQYEPQFIKVKEEQMPENDDDDDTSHTIRSDEDVSDIPDEEMAEAVMFPIVKTEYNTTDTSQKDGADEHAFGTVNDDKVTNMTNTVYPLLLYSKVQGQTLRYACMLLPLA